MLAEIRNTDSVSVFFGMPNFLFPIGITTPFYPQIKIKGVQIKIKGLQIKITGYQIKIWGHQIKIKGLQIKIRGLQN